MKYLFVSVLLLLSSPLFAQTKISSSELGKHVGDSVTVCEKIDSGRFLEASSLTLLNMGKAYPNQLFTIVIRGKDREKFTGKPEEIYKDKIVCVTGKVTEYQGKQQIVVTNPAQLAIQQINGQ